MMQTRTILAVFVVGLISMAVHADIPLTINHQGIVKVEGVPYTGQGQFKFGFYDAIDLKWLWTNDGNLVGQSISQAPFNALSLNVVNGNYSVRLGDTGLGANMKAIPSSVFNGDNVLLRIYFNDGVNGENPLLPDQPVTSGAYAFHAHTADTVPGYIDGGVLSNDETDPTNSLHITELICRDDQDIANIQVSAMSKRVDANWASGDGSGGLDAGTIGSTQVLVYVWAIGDSTGQNPGDILFSKSGLTPGLPGGYDVKRFIGARLWMGAEWIRFRSEGRGRDRTVAVLDVLQVYDGVISLVSTGYGPYESVSFGDYVACGFCGEISFSCSWNSDTNLGALHFYVSDVDGGIMWSNGITLGSTMKQNGGTMPCSIGANEDCEAQLRLWIGSADTQADVTVRMRIISYEELL